MDKWVKYPDVRDLDAKLKAETAEAEAICKAAVEEAERILGLTTGPAIERWRAEYKRRFNLLNR